MYVVMLWMVIGGHLTLLNQTASFDDFATCRSVAAEYNDGTIVAKCVPAHEAG